MKRIHIVGSTGSGKTSLAAEVSMRLDIPHTEMDSLHWQENWLPAEEAKFREAVHDAVSGDTWIIDGNYSRTRPIIWSRVGTVVWLDYPVIVPFCRLFRRSLRRVFFKELLWGRNRESFREQFLSRESLFMYLFKTHWSRREMYASLIQDPQYASIQFVRLRSPRQARQWLDGLEAH